MRAADCSRSRPNKLAGSARRGAVADRSRRELGMAACELSDGDFPAR